jgi:hypothetical protein
MARRSPFASRLLALLGAAALGSSGCGLSEYANQMSSEAGRVRAWKEENDLLGKPIWMPEFPKKDNKVQTWEVFLRLPQGVSDAPVTLPKSNFAQMYGPLVQYPAFNNKLGIQAVYVGVTGDPKDFATKVYGQFGVEAGGEQPVNVPRSITLHMAIAKGVSPEITVKRKIAEGQSVYNFSFYERGPDLVAVVFQLEKGTGNKADNAIRASLATLGEGSDDAYALSSAYSKANRKPKKVQPAASKD